MDAGFIEAACFRITIADCQVDTASDLFDVKDAFCKTFDTAVGADGKLTKVSNSIIGIEHTDQEVHIFFARASTTLPSLNSSSTPSTSHPSLIAG
jgi:hypothetical protein